MATVLQGLIARQSYSVRSNVRAVTTTDLDNVGNGTWVTSGATLTAGSAGLTTIDGIVLADGDRVLVKDQTAVIENGIYEVSDAAVGSATVFTRAADMYTADLASGSYAFSIEGTANLRTGWICTALAGADVVGTDNITWKQFDVIETLKVARGGTGATSFTTNALIIGNGTSALQTVTAVNNAVLITNGSGVPSWSTTLPSGLTASFADNAFSIYDDGDNTKIMQFQASAITTGTTRTYTVPDADTTLVGTDTTQTLTNKTITSGRYNQLNDTNGNEVVIIPATASAVNHFTFTNAATGTNPVITATGDDANIGLNFLVKGTGKFNFLASASGPTEIRLFEDTDNGANYIGIDVPAAITADLTFTLPGTDGAAGDFLSTDGSGNLSFVTPSSGRVAYAIAPHQIFVNGTTYTTVGYFAWKQSRYSSYTSGALVYEVVIGNRNLDIRLYDSTAPAAVVTDAGVAVSAFRAVTGFTNPTADARIELQVRKSGAGGVNPDIFGVQIEWVPN
jgi:hypothetical protein